MASKRTLAPEVEMRIVFKFVALVIAPVFCFGLIPLSSADTGASIMPLRDSGSPVAVRMIGDTEKVCQLTGEKDWDTGQPTAARTFSNFGLDACDLGYPVEHDGKLIILFGDSWPPPHGGGPAGEIPPDDAVGMTTRTAPPNKEDGRCLEITVHHTPAKKFAPAAIVGPNRVKQGFFNVPSGGVSVGGALYGFFWTNHCSDPNKLSPSPGDPLVRPPAQGGCPETDDRNSVGRGVLARSDDDGRTFSNVVPMPEGFVYTTAANTGPLQDVPADQRLGVFIFAAPRYRASVPYLAYAPVESFADTATWRFFTGLGPNGQPTWVSRDQWNRGRPVPSRPAPAGFRPPWSPLGEPELFTPKMPAGQSVGELSVTWNHVLHLWLMLYGGPGGMLARVARAPWGPWSEATRILGGEDWLACHLLMTADGCGNRRDYWPGGHKNGKFVGGGLYAPYVLNRYTTAAGVGAPGGSSCTIYWVVSTWNPYEVTVMRTTLQVDGGGVSNGGGGTRAGS
jgi:hypothetical protein